MGRVQKSTQVRGNNNSIINQIQEGSALTHALEIQSKTNYGLMRTIRELRKKLTDLERDYRELKISYSALKDAFMERESEIDGRARRVMKDIIPALASLFILIEAIQWHFY